MAAPRWRRSTKAHLVEFKALCFRGGRGENRRLREAHLKITEPGGGSVGESGNGRQRRSQLKVPTVLGNGKIILEYCDGSKKRRKEVMRTCDQSRRQGKVDQFGKLHCFEKCVRRSQYPVYQQRLLTYFWTSNNGKNVTECIHKILKDTATKDNERLSRWKRKTECKCDWHTCRVADVICLGRRLTLGRLPLISAKEWMDRKSFFDTKSELELPHRVALNAEEVNEGENSDARMGRHMSRMNLV